MQDNDLSRGTTGPCETFASRPLVASQEFACVSVEVWGFTCNNTAPNQADVRKKSVLS